MKKIYFTVALIVMLTSSFSFSQEVDLGVALYSRYIWRGLDFGNAPSFQPAVTFTAGGFSIGEWGAYSISGVGSVYSEDDLWASYAVSTPSAGTFTLIATDYFFPSAGMKYFNYKGDGAGAHTIEAGLSYGGPDKFPITLSGYMNVHNDVDNTTYFEASYPFTVQSVFGSVVVGATGGGDNGFYGPTNFQVINIGLNFSKDIVITDKFSLPISASIIVNPNIEQSYLIVGISL
jgi:hypothetical protein